jgi:phage repressor protein C with HTH and peptisase S24 domain
MHAAVAPLARKCKFARRRGKPMTGEKRTGVQMTSGGHRRQGKGVRAKRASEPGGHKSAAEAGGMSARLRRARERAGFETPADAARNFGWIYPTYAAHENGQRGYKTEEARKYARAFGVNSGWLMTGEGPIYLSQKMPLSGVVTEGGEIVGTTIIAEREELLEVDRPPDAPEDLLAFRVHGGHLYPVYNDGEVVYCRAAGEPPDALIGKHCIVRTRDGRRFLRVIAMRVAIGVFTLTAFNQPPEPDVRVDWASPIEWVKRG